jgi:hypothetical protein
MKTTTWAKRDTRRAQIAILHALLLYASSSAAGEALLSADEHKLKVASIYNFAQFTQWPAEVGGTLNLCVHGPDSLGTSIDELQGKSVDERRITVLRRNVGDSLLDCQIVFISMKTISSLPRVLAELHERPVLTVADTPGAAQQGVVINMAIASNKVTFEVNLKTARAARLHLSSKLLRVATEVYQ